MSFCRALLLQDRQEPGDVALHAGRRTALFLDHSPGGEAPQPRELPAELKEPVFELIGILLSQSLSFHSWHSIVPPSLFFSSPLSCGCPWRPSCPALPASSSLGRPQVVARRARPRRARPVEEALPQSQRTSGPRPLE